MKCTYYNILLGKNRIKLNIKKKNSLPLTLLTRNSFFEQLV